MSLKKLPQDLRIEIYEKMDGDNLINAVNSLGKEKKALLLRNPKAHQVAKKYFNYLINSHIENARNYDCITNMVKKGVVGVFDKVVNFAQEIISGREPIETAKKVQKLIEQDGKHLSELDLSQLTPKEADYIIDALPNQLNKLETLHVDDISSKQLNALMKKCPKLKTLIITNSELGKIDFNTFPKTLVNFTFSSTQIGLNDLESDFGNQSET